MKILYASGLSPNDSSLYRLWALERLGHEAVAFNAYEYNSGNPLLQKIGYRLAAGPAVKGTMLASGDGIDNSQACFHQ